MPRYPFLPGICISSARSLTTSFSGVTISSWKVSAIESSSIVRRWPEPTPCNGSPLPPTVKAHSRLFARSLGRGSLPATNERRPSTALLGCRFHLLGSLEHLFDRALHVEGLLGDVVVLARNDVAEA